MKRTNQNIFYSPNTKETARFAKALSHPVRLTILKHLSSQNCCFTGDLVDILPLAQSTISQHLKELKNAGLIQGEVDPPKVKYCINENNWKKAKDLFESLFQEDFSKISCCQ
jgi:DNA-binding transcriptional ArsR family regulator